MRRMSVVILLLLATTLCLAAASSSSQNSDAKALFLASNPNNGWEYGFVDENGGFVPYNSTFDDGQGIAGWCLDRCPGPMGAITINYSDHAIDEYGVHWEPGQICVLPPSGGLSAVIRWHAPTAETVRVDTVLTCQTPNATADVALAANGRRLAGGRIGLSPSGAVAGSDAHTASAESSSAESGRLARSTVINVGRGQILEVLITGDPEQPSGHIVAAVFINSVGSNGIIVGKCSLGKRTSDKQVMLFGPEQWSQKTEFDALVGRG